METRMADNPNPPQGEPIDWSDEDIERLTGIDDDGNIKPAVLADIKAWAASKFPELYGLITAETEDKEE